MNKGQILRTIESAQLKSDRKNFNVGDSVRVHTIVKEGDKERVQIFSGVVIARRGSLINESFTVRRISYGEGVERVFPLHSPRIAKIEVKKAGSVRRAKLYYIRDRVGKAVKIKLDVKRQEQLDKASLAAATEAAAVKAAAAREQTATTGESKRAATRKAKAEAEKKK